MAWTNFEAPAGKKLGSYGGLKFLTSAEYKASPWGAYGVEWSRTLTAVPECAWVWVPFCNAPCYEDGEEPNVELRCDRRNRQIALWSKKAIQGKQPLLLGYGSQYSKQLSNVRDFSEEAAAKFQDRWDKAKEDGIPVHYNEQCAKCGARLSKAKLRVHHLHHCPGFL